MISFPSCHFDKTKCMYTVDPNGKQWKSSIVKLSGLVLSDIDKKVWLRNVLNLIPRFVTKYKNMLTDYFNQTEWTVLLL